MLSRRHIRIKVLQALYGYTRDDRADARASESNLRTALDKIYDLYLYELRLLHELRLAAEHYIDLALNKRLPTHEDLHPNRKFLNNRFLLLLAESDSFVKACEDRHINWSEEQNIIRSLFQKIKKSEVYESYMASEEDSWENDKRIVRKLYDEFIIRNEDFHQLYEDKNLHWADDLDAAQMMVEKTLRKAGAKSAGTDKVLVKLYKDAEDQDFGPKLFLKVVQSMDDSMKRISDKARNWEMDRIAALDILFMQMAIAEFRFFDTVPLKVTMNEYIELSKAYSTPKSGMFVNGVLDKVLADLKSEGLVRKIGRGLLET